MFEGAFNAGWDVLRGQVFENQKRIDIIPEHAVLIPCPSYIPPGLTCRPQSSHFTRDRWEVAAAQLAHFDHQFGRALEVLSADGHLDNTLVVFVQGDNGACQEYEYGNTDYGWRLRYRRVRPSATPRAAVNLAWFKRYVPEDARTHISDIISGLPMIALTGPRSRDLLSRISPDDFSHESFPLGTSKEVDLGYARARVST